MQSFLLLPLAFTDSLSGLSVVGGLGAIVGGPTILGILAVFAATALETGAPGATAQDVGGTVRADPGAPAVHANPGVDWGAAAEGPFGRDAAGQPSVWG